MDLELAFAFAVRNSPSSEEIEFEIGEFWQIMRAIAMPDDEIEISIRRHVVKRRDGTFAARQLAPKMAPNS